MSNPFDWKNQPSKINMRDLDIANKCSYQQSAIINRRRAKGEEPSIIYSEKSPGVEPKKFVVKMPDMPLNPRSIKKRRNK